MGGAQRREWPDCLGSRWGAVRNTEGPWVGVDGGHGQGKQKGNNILRHGEEDFSTQPKYNMGPHSL